MHPIDKTIGGKAFRYDINGLRAIAVLVVVLFHFQVPFFQSGFIGVDVFFVISGFLMTQIILTGIGAGAFSLPTFYAARFRRILPALAVLCLLLLAAGWFWLAPQDYSALGKHAASSVGFYSNFVYKDEAGYFDAPAQFKWLLHTWSLSAEWQFYLLYPLILLGISRKFPVDSRGFCLCLWGMVVASLSCSIHYSPERPDFAFYLLPTRIWEMVAGGLVYIYAQRHPLKGSRLPVMCEVAGLTLILSMVLLLPEGAIWPGYFAILPVLGTALVLYAGNTVLLKSRLLQAVGTGSYSIYLWHWPMVVVLTYLTLEGAQWQMLGITLSFLLGWLSYRWVEMPIRQAGFLRTPRQTFTMAALAIAVVAGSGMMINAADGYAHRVSGMVRIADDEATNYNNGKQVASRGCQRFDRVTTQLEDCAIGDDGEVNPPYLLVGDSHAGVLHYAMGEALGEASYQFYGYTCATLWGSEIRSKAHRRDNCPIFNRKVQEKIAAMPQEGKVIVLNRYSVHVRGPNEKKSAVWGFLYDDVSEEERTLSRDALYQKRLSETLCQMQAIRPVAAVLPIPEMGIDVPKALARKLMLHDNVPDITLPMEEYEERHAVVLEALQMAHEQCGVELLDVRPYLCPDGKTCMGSHQGRPLYYDDDHLSAYGASFLTPLLRGYLLK